MASKKETAQRKAADTAKGKGPSAKSPTLQPSALATQKDSRLSTQTTINFEEQLIADAGLGSENIGTKDLAIPRIGVLQSLSPQCTKGNPLFNKEMHPGDFFDNVTQSVYAEGDDGFLFIPVRYRRALLEWVPRGKGGGFAGDHGNDESILAKAKRNEIGQDILPSGNEIVVTGEFFALLLDLDGKNPRQAVISLAKTQFKKATRLNSAIRLLSIPHPKAGERPFNPAMFYSTFKATTVPESNDKGSWMGWNIIRYSDTVKLKDGTELYQMARQFNEAVSAGTVKVAAPADPGESDAGSNDLDEKL
jgi:hypothetical protein